jgi:hypothetical protein
MTNVTPNIPVMKTGLQAWKLRGSFGDLDGIRTTKSTVILTK